MDRKDVKDGRKLIGFVRRTAGGFWRAYSYVSGMGMGPLASEAAAEAWVRGEAVASRGTVHA